MVTGHPPQPSKRRFWIFFFSIGIAITAVDLWSKHAVFELLEVKSSGEPPRVQFQRPAVVIPGFFDLEANYNYGAFSGWFSKRTAWLTALSVLALVVIVTIVAYVLRRPRPPSRWFIAALALVWGGTLGNLYDRLFLAAVRDWIKWFVVWGDKEYVWPNFNVADSAICVGVGILIVVELFGSRKDRETKGESTTPPSPR